MTAESSDKSRTALIFERQGIHLLCLIVLLPGCVWASRLNGVQDGALWGYESLTWYWFAIAIAVVHQVYVWFCWRTELHGGLLSTVLGSNAFAVYAFGFAVIALTRVFTVFAVAIANQGSLPGNDVILNVTAMVLLIPTVYVFYSVHRYFTFRRAVGIDHFDPAMANTTFVRQGIFRFTDNAMYTFGFLLLWTVALWWASTAAVCVALFNHLYIWVHYFATERPDIARIYGANGEQ